jgi:hypothetical protein
VPLTKNSPCHGPAEHGVVRRCGTHVAPVAIEIVGWPLVAEATGEEAQGPPEGLSYWWRRRESKRARTRGVHDFAARKHDSTRGVPGWCRVVYRMRDRCCGSDGSCQPPSVTQFGEACHGDPGCPNTCNELHRTQRNERGRSTEPKSRVLLRSFHTLQLRCTRPPACARQRPRHRGSSRAGCNTSVPAIDDTRLQCRSCRS